MQEDSEQKQKKVRRMVDTLTAIAAELEKWTNDPKFVGPDLVPSSNDVRFLAAEARKALDEYSAPDVDATEARKALDEYSAPDVDATGARLQRDATLAAFKFGERIGRHLK